MQTIEIFAPIIIPTLNRYVHLRRCVESLMKCTWAKNTELYISIDYPPTESYREGYDEVVKYVYTITGFKRVNIYVQIENLGPGGNLLFLQKQISSKYEYYISTEDDNVFSPCFLDYMNKALIKYKNDTKIMSVSGYTPLCHKDIGRSIYFSYDNSAWGFGGWFYKSQIIKGITSEYYRSLLKDTKSVVKILYSYPSLFLMFYWMVKNNKNYGDTKYTIYNIMNDTLQVKPNVSLVCNIGNDGTGVNCSVNTLLADQKISKDEYFIFPKDDDLEMKHIGKLELWRLSFYPKYLFALYKLLLGVFSYIIWRFHNR